MSALTLSLPEINVNILRICSSMNMVAADGTVVSIPAPRRKPDFDQCRGED